MRSAELAETALSMRNVAFGADDAWTTFEVIENGELGKVSQREARGNVTSAVSHPALSRRL